MRGAKFGSREIRPILGTHKRGVVGNEERGEAKSM